MGSISYSQATTCCQYKRAIPCRHVEHYRESSHRRVARPLRSLHVAPIVSSSALEVPGLAYRAKGRQKTYRCFARNPPRPFRRRSFRFHRRRLASYCLGPPSFWRSVVARNRTLFEEPPSCVSDRTNCEVKNGSQTHRGGTATRPTWL